MVEGLGLRVIPEVLLHKGSHCGEAVLDTDVPRDAVTTEDATGFVGSRVGRGVVQGAGREGLLGYREG